jgi:hypothetical protein
MNTGMNRIDAVQDFILKNCIAKPVILYPSDCWNVVSELNAAHALGKYLLDYEKMKENSLIKSNIVSVEYLTENAKEFLNRLNMKNSKFRNRISKWTTNIYVSDLQTSFALNMKTGLKITNLSPEYCDINLTSEALNYVFENEWGGDTLNVNARFQIPSNGNYFHFKRFGHVASLNNRGEEYTEPSYIKKIARLIIGD